MAQASGKKERVVIACVTFETTKITDSVFYYDATRVHLIHYVSVSTDPEKRRSYTAFYDQVYKIIETNSERKIEIVEHNATVYDFSVMLRTVLEIIKKEYGNDVYVNTSAGTSEYTAASVIAAMMNPETIPFTVGTKEFTVSSEKAKEIYYNEDGEPVGLTKVPKEPTMLPSYYIKMPEEHLVKALRILHELNGKKHKVSSHDVIKVMIKRKVWFRNSDEIKIDIEKDEKGNKKSRLNQTSAVYYHRDYVERWLEYGWVRKDDLLKKYVLTDEGEKVIETFHTEE